jgi:hypothetical protein
MIMSISRARVEAIMAQQKADRLAGRVAANASGWGDKLLNWQDKAVRSMDRFTKTSAALAEGRKQDDIRIMGIFERALVLPEPKVAVAPVVTDEVSMIDLVS